MVLDIIKFEEVLLNEGSGYNSTTGLFTAPTSGVYQFSYFIEHHIDPPGQSWARLMANGTVVTQRAHDVTITSYQRRCDVMTSHRRRSDVILTSCACWVTLRPLMRFITIRTFKGVTLGLLG